MRFRGKSIRWKIVALLLVPLVSLTALWGFATVITGRQALKLLDVSYVIDKVGYPVEDVVRVIQKERRQTLVVLGDPRASAATAELTKRRADTDELVRKISVNAKDPEVVDELSDDALRRLRSILDAFHGIDALRNSVDQTRLDPSQALELYNRLVDPCYDFLQNLHALEDVQMDKEGRALVGITRAREALAREDAVVAAALAARNVSAVDLRRVSDAIANRQVLYQVNLDILPADDRVLFEQFWSGPQTKPLREAEEKLIAAGPGKNPKLTSAQWDEVALHVLDDVAVMGTAAGDRYKERVEPVALDVLIKAAVAGILGFAALIVSLVLSVRIGSELIRDLSRLRKEAHEASGVRLPSVMRRLAAGEQVDVETEAPRLEYEKDEVGQVGHALNTLQRAAVEAAVKQAELRRGVSEVFVNLARRNQVLLHRQLTLLDTMERRTEDTEELADLFRLDHMTTRMRRHAEGLVILSGAAPSRQWRKPVQLMDVVRAAVAEVEDYERIEVRRLPRLGITGPAVADITHLVAELLENATVFSPPHTAVQVHGERVANGFTLEIHDRGLGMTPEALLDANLRISDSPEFALSDTDRLGLFVVSRLAQRHHVKVSLQPSPYGGTTAVVLLPAALLTDAPETNGSGLQLGGPDRSRRTTPAVAAARPGGRGNGTAGRHPLPAALLDGPVELEAPLSVLGLDAPAAPGDVPALAGVRPPMASLDDETPPGGTPRSALLGLRPAEVDRTDRGGRDKRDRRDRTDPWDKRDTAGTAGAPTGPVRLDGAGTEAPGPDAPRTPSGAVPLPRRRRTPTLVAEHGRRVGTRPVSVVPQPGTGPDTAPDRAPRPEAPAAPAAAPGGLPRRVRQANLAPQLRNTPHRPAAEASAAPVADRDADEVRARMSSLQRGWTAGRRQNAEQQPEAGTGTTAATTGPEHQNENEGDGR
ncbi:nitrate- and nitrite sensing domain-containing protein [Streptomyces sp. WAC06614]|uniref:nitrate- and nitrite sensing domain-containing protein n=1 Tax=Streptomyces sp. WAC06614 TaxID=2487416 RepID=UPI000F76C4D6|nr:nitrate- and nitrite sensing domain-containing protein [Streptomyces sp. WAC06614]RSS60945.1 HAMP domain-containing protein [Streptomyces sp. WAC06614]